MVTPPTERPTTDDDRGGTRTQIPEESTRNGQSRGQLILLGALLLSFTIVASVVLLNTIQVNPAVGADQEGTELRQAELTTQQVENSLHRLFLANGSAIEQSDRLPFALEEFSRQINRTYQNALINLSTAGTASVVTVEYVDSESIEGVLIRQDDSRNFTSPPNATDWQVAENVSTLPRVSLRVEAVDTAGFRVRLEEVGDDGWVQLNVTEKTVVRTNRSAPATPVSLCSGLDLPSEIDLVYQEGEIRGTNTTCPGVEFGTELDAPYNLTFRNGNEASGNYTISMTGDTVSSVINDTQDANPRWIPSDSSPDNQYVVDPAFRVSYRSPGIDYAREFNLFGGGETDG
jgi:hypothetical protein